MSGSKAYAPRHHRLPPMQPYNDTDVSAAIWGRAAEYLHGVSVNGAKDLHHLAHNEPTEVARQAILEAVQVTAGRGTPQQVVELVSQVVIDPELHRHGGLTLTSATGLAVQRLSQARERHPEDTPKDYLRTLTAHIAAEVITGRTYEPDYRTDESTAVRIGEAGADLLHQLVRIIVGHFPARRQNAESIALLNSQFIRLNRETPHPAWLPD